jgi:hypothetical protein
VLQKYGNDDLAVGAATMRWTNFWRKKMWAWYCA